MESNLSSAPQLDIIQSKQDRRDAGISHFEYVDAANQARMAQYNNEYNYWLWLQQAKYNSPAEQRKRLEEAGLNPNFQSVESGNLSSIPTSSGSITPSVGRNRAAMVANDIQAFNAVIRSISEGVSAYSNLANTPSLDDLKGFRKNVAQFMGNRAGAAEMDKIIKSIEAAFTGKSKLGLDLPILVPNYFDNGDPYFDRPDWSKSPMLRNLGLKNDDLNWLVQLRKFDFQSMKPEELKLIQERTKQIAEAAGLTAQQSQLFTTMTATKVGAMLGPLLLGIIKMFF